MKFSIAAAAGLVLAAEAFMIPSTMSLPGVHEDDVGQSPDDGDFHILRIPDGLTDALKKLSILSHSPAAGFAHVSLECGGCSFTPKDRPDVRLTGGLDFTLSDDRTTVFLNGHHFFPLGVREPLFATSRLADDASILPEGVTATRGAYESIPRELEFSAYARYIEAADGTNEKIIELTLQVLGLADKNGEERISVDSVDIRLLSDEEGHLNLLTPITKPNDGAAENGRTHRFPVHPGPHGPRPSACPNDASPMAMICRLREAIASRLHSFAGKRPCPHSKGHHGPTFRPTFNGHYNGGEMPHLPHMLHGGPDKYGHHYPPPPPYAFRTPHHPGFLHSFAMGLRAFVLGFVLPVIIGALAGMVAGMVGLIVGSLVRHMWINVVRGGRRGNASAVAAEAEAVPELESEKARLLEADVEAVAEAPPVYQEKEVSQE